jgi:hypothetical protein
MASVTPMRPMTCTASPRRWRVRPLHPPAGSPVPSSVPSHPCPCRPSTGTTDHTSLLWARALTQGLTCLILLCLGEGAQGIWEFWLDPSLPILERVSMAPAFPYCLASPLSPKHLLLEDCHPGLPLSYKTSFFWPADACPVVPYVIKAQPKTTV